MSDPFSYAGFIQRLEEIEAERAQHVLAYPDQGAMQAFAWSSQVIHDATLGSGVPLPIQGQVTSDELQALHTYLTANTPPMELQKPAEQTMAKIEGIIADVSGITPQQFQAAADHYYAFTPQNPNQQG